MGTYRRAPCDGCGGEATVALVTRAVLKGADGGPPRVVHVRAIPFCGPCADDRRAGLAGETGGVRGGR